MNLHKGLMLTIGKVFIILFVLVRIGNILAIFKINQYALISIASPRVFSSCVMTMKNESKFEQELNCQFKTDMRNLTNFDPNTQISQ